MGRQPGGLKRILVVDDDDRVLWVLYHTLARLGGDYEIVPAHDGLEALNEASKKPFDLLVTDLMLPGIDGVELTKAVRSLNPAVAVIWITAQASGNVVREAARLSVFHCFSKPTEITEIRQVARKALEADDRDAQSNVVPLALQTRVMS
ncbi:MAG: response regulator [Anaerolineae bacterium]